MRQSRRMSFAESCVNVAVGYFVALAVQIAVFPAFDMAVSLADNFAISGIFTLVSIIRSYAVRRGFNWYYDRCW